MTFLPHEILVLICEYSPKSKEALGLYPKSCFDTLEGCAYCRLKPQDETKEDPFCSEICVEANAEEWYVYIYVEKAPYLDVDPV